MDTSVKQVLYSVSSIARIVKGKIITQRSDDPEIRNLLIDSRKLASPEYTLFFALTSRRNDGHKYISELYGKGVRSFMVSQVPEDRSIYVNASFTLVPDTLKALQTLSAHHRKLFNIPVIGITGSNGKTIVKDWLSLLLGEDKRVVNSPKSYNSQIGVPLSVWNLKEGTELGIFEAGISEQEEMERLQQIIQPTIGIFTNIGHAHDENFINLSQKVSEKLKLFTHVDTLIYCDDHVDIKSRLMQGPSFRKTRLFTWGRKEGTDLMMREVKYGHKYTEIKAVWLNKEIAIRIPFTDIASLENSMHCWALMLYMGYDPGYIASRMIHLNPVAMRMELKEGINSCSIINDSYSSDLNSLAIALDFLGQQKQHRKHSVILSDMLQSGKTENELYQEIADLLNSKSVDRIVGIGPAISRHSSKFRMEHAFFQSTEDFLMKFPFSSFHNETILIKGARAFEFERIGKALQQKAHETVLEINMNAMVHNLNVIRTRLDPKTRIMVMVKAFSYGSGSFEIANLLQFHHVEYLAVAYADEGIELRKAGITLPIMIMNPDEESIDALGKFDLEPEVYSFRILDLIEESRKQVYSEKGKPKKVHIKLDTGMHRLGFDADDLPELARRLQANRGIRVASIFSHLAASNDPKHDAFTMQQFRLFEEMSKFLMDHLPNSPLRHILNSAGISRFPAAQFDMVRLGIGLYGVPYNEKDEILLQNVSTLRSSVSQIKKVASGESIGYSRAWTARKNMTVAIVPIGYADGLNRRLGNGKGRMVISKHLCPIVGDICMDMCMVDVTGLNVKEGEPVIIFGDLYPLTKLAADLDTIPYEILTGISRRVKRVYYQE